MDGRLSKEDYNKAVDDLVNINKLFTLAVFLGLALATGGQRSLENRAECDAGTSIASRLIVFEVLSFTCFLSSTVVAMAVKLHLTIHGGGGGGGGAAAAAAGGNGNDDNSDMTPRYRLSMKKLKHGVRERMVFLAGMASFLAYFFLMLSMVDIIQIRLGMLSCGAAKSLIAAVSVVSIVSAALLVFLFLMLPALYNSISHVEE